MLAVMTKMLKDKISMQQKMVGKHILEAKFHFGNQKSL